MDLAWNLVLDFLAETPVEPVEQPLLDVGILGDPDIELALGHVDVLSQVAACNADSRRELQPLLSDWRAALGRMTSAMIETTCVLPRRAPAAGNGYLQQRSGFEGCVGTQQPDSSFRLLPMPFGVILRFS